MRRFDTKNLVRGAVTAALYAALTFVIPFSSGLMQVRLSEALCVLPYFFPASVWGLGIGCLLGNMLSGGIPIDVIGGSLATLFAAFLTYLMKKHNVSMYLAPLPSVVINALAVGAILAFGYELASFATCMLYVAIGQIIACYGVGIPLMLTLKRLPAKIFSTIGKNHVPKR